MAGRSTPGTATRRRKRPAPSVYGGINATYEDKDNDYVCPICFDMIEEAFMTKCGHSYCHKCIKQSLEVDNRCPKCNFNIEKKDDIFPNILLNELILKQKQKQQEQKKLKLDRQNGSLSGGDVLGSHDAMDISQISHLLDMLQRRKEQLEAECKAVQNQMLKDFLQQVRKKKQEQLDQLSKELRLIDTDLDTVHTNLKRDKTSGASTPTEGVATIPNGFDPAAIPGPSSSKDAPTTTSNNTTSNTTATTTSNSTSNSTANTSTTGQDGFNGGRNTGRPWLHTTMAARRKKVNQHFDDLEQCYLSLRERDILGTIDVGDGRDSLDEFTESLSKFTRFSAFRSLATLNYASDIYNTSSIVSSIEFDRDCDYFAIAGVTKKIKVFEYGTVIRDQVDMHYPIVEMVCNSKISSIVWSSYHKGMLASADYEGTVTLWDAYNGTKTRMFQEHEKRCWSLDFNTMDPKLLASGSDDSRVKLWYTNMEHSIASIEAKANVCCVRFNPNSRHHLAFGSADHSVHYYDLRNTKTQLGIFKGHRKAVSYTKFLSGTEIVSASTDSQLKLWNIDNKSHCLRTFRGHTNEKNFVGLATDGDYIACGSENNSLYVYYKGLSKQLLAYKFEPVRSVLEKEKKEDDSNEFVSAVCWKPHSNVILAANSHGIIKVLELV